MMSPAASSLQGDLDLEALKGRQRSIEPALFVAREPLFHFVVLGLLIYLGATYLNTKADRYTIRVTPEDRSLIALSYQRQFGAAPSAEQLRGLVDRHVRDEIFFREGLALHLNADDEIVRRRIIQKYEFVQSDLASPEPPSDSVLQRWFTENRARYLTPERVGFSQVYFSPDVGGSAVAKERAETALEQLSHTRVSRTSELGDAFPGPSDVGAATPDEATRLFGESELSNELFKVPSRRWTGPYRSGYGWHLIYVTERIPAAVPVFDEVRERVLVDYLRDRQNDLNVQSFRKVRAKYTVRYEDSP